MLRSQWLHQLRVHDILWGDWKLRLVDSTNRLHVLDSTKPRTIIANDGQEDPMITTINRFSASHGKSTCLSLAGWRPNLWGAWLFILLRGKNPYSDAKVNYTCIHWGVSNDHWQPQSINTQCSNWFTTFLSRYEHRLLEKLIIGRMAVPPIISSTSNQVKQKGRVPWCTHDVVRIVRRVRADPNPPGLCKDFTSPHLSWISTVYICGNWSKGFASTSCG